CHCNPAHRELREVHSVDRKKRIGGHQLYRLGLRPPERTCAIAAALRNSSTTLDEARRPVMSGRPGNAMVTLCIPPPAKAGIDSGARTMPPSANRPMPSSTSRRLPPERRKASRNASTPGWLTARAGVMNSPLLTQARLLSEVPVPRPRSGPPPAMPCVAGSDPPPPPPSEAPPPRPRPRFTFATIQSHTAWKVSLIHCQALPGAVVTNVTTD